MLVLQLTELVTERANTTPLTIKRKTVALGYTAKILEELVIDAEL